MDAEYGRVYRELHRRHWWWRAREQVVIRELSRIRGAGDDRGLLDVGCGDGLLLERLETFGPSYGIEPDAALVSADNPRRNRIHVGHLTPAYRAPTPIATALMLDVIEHIADPVPTLTSVRQLLPADGALLVTVPARMELWTSHDVLNHHVTRYTPRTLAATLSAGGFKIERMRYFFRWLALPKLAVHAMEAVRPSRPSVPRVPPAPLNYLLYAISTVEERLLGERIGAPGVPGSSLLAVARPA